MTRTRTGTVKPKQFDGEKFITPVKRKASTPTPVVPTEVKRVRVVPEVILEPPEPVDSPEKEEKGNNPSDSESDLTEAADKADKKLTVSSNKILHFTGFQQALKTWKTWKIKMKSWNLKKSE